MSVYMCVELSLSNIQQNWLFDYVLFVSQIWQYCWSEPLEKVIYSIKLL